MIEGDGMELNEVLVGEDIGSLDLDGKIIEGGGLLFVKSDLGVVMVVYD